MVPPYLAAVDGVGLIVAGIEVADAVVAGLVVVGAVLVGPVEAVIAGAVVVTIAGVLVVGVAVGLELQPEITKTQIKPVIRGMYIFFTQFLLLF
jgi:hypothetical protein